MKEEPKEIEINFDVDKHLLGETQAAYEAWVAMTQNKEPERVEIVDVMEAALISLRDFCRIQVARLGSVSVDHEVKGEH